MDPLSDLLSVLNPDAYAAAGFDFGGAWSVAFPRQAGVKCFAVLSGEGCLVMAGVETPVFARTGDCLVLPHGRAFRVASDLALAPIDATTLYSASPEAGMTLYQGGGDTTGFASHFELSGPAAGFLLEGLPPIMHMRQESQRSTLRWCLERMMQELLEPAPGRAAVLQQLARMILVEALRQYLAHRPPGATGWLFALSDSKIASALMAMHDQPGEAWSLQRLAERAGMSRTSFAAAFTSLVGQSPMAYLTRWRMMLAVDRLGRPNTSVSAVAQALGYESESAFSTAFKREMGRSPRQHAQARVPS